jgi:hypothetical protein
VWAILFTCFFLVTCANGIQILFSSVINLEVSERAPIFINRLSHQEKYKRITLISLPVFSFQHSFRDQLSLVVNSGFEDGLKGWLNTGDVIYEADNSTMHSGSYSCKGIETESGNLGRLYQDVTELVIPGRKYKIGGWIKANGVTGAGVVLALDYVNSEGLTSAEGYVMEIGHVTGTQDWAFFESEEFTLKNMASDCVATWFLFDFNVGAGMAWWDDVYLEDRGLGTLEDTITTTTGQNDNLTRFEIVFLPFSVIVLILLNKRRKGYSDC